MAGKGLFAGAQLAVTPVTADDGSTIYQLQTSGTGGGAATVANGADVAEGATTDAAYTDATGAAAGSLVALHKGAYVLMKGTGTASQQVQGSTTRGATIAGSPVLAGGRGSSSAPAAVTAGQAVDAWYSLSGATVIAAGLNGTPNGGGSTVNLSYAINAATAPFGVLNYVWSGTSVIPVSGDASGTVMQPHALTASRWQFAGVTGGITDTSDVAIAAAAGASLRNYLTAIQFANTGIASEIVVKDGATVIWRGYALATTGDQQSVTFPVPLKGTANTALNVAMITTASATRVSAQGYTAA